uniref:Uncharacterized protein n=1 Tax=Anguilla anguilla TaxID=7936 RepID=A0A0E9XT26_ANGAN
MFVSTCGITFGNGYCSRILIFTILM